MRQTRSSLHDLSPVRSNKEIVSNLSLLVRKFLDINPALVVSRVTLSLTGRLNTDRLIYIFLLHHTSHLYINVKGIISTLISGFIFKSANVAVKHLESE